VAGQGGPGQSAQPARCPGAARCGHAPGIVAVRGAAPATQTPPANQVPRFLTNGVSSMRGCRESVGKPYEDEGASCQPGDGEVAVAG
jgi:hypothetical protein